MNNSLVIKLNDNLFIGSGCHKATYLHPYNPNNCIKILINNNNNAVKQLHRELAHNKTLQQKCPDLRGLSRYLGEIKTNYGIGYQFELVKDYDDEVSKSLIDYLNDESYLISNRKKIFNDLSILKKNMLKYKIIPMTIQPHNILYKKVNLKESEFIIIDDIGTAAFIPLEYYSHFFATKRIQRKWKRFFVQFENKLV